MQPNLAAVLVEARRAAGLSQAELARRAGISASYLSRIEGAAWEHGGPWPSDSVLRALARALGLSSTDLVAMQRTARSGHPAASPAGHPARTNRRLPYAVALGHDEVDRAARDLIRRNPAHGTLRSVHVGTGDGGCAYADALASALAADPATMLYQLRRTDEQRVAAANVRTHTTASNPVVLDVLIGDREVLLALPDRRGLPYLRAGVVVDDPDFVAAIRQWFDESRWDPPPSPGAEERPHPAGPGVVAPPAAPDLPDGGAGVGRADRAGPPSARQAATRAGSGGADAGRPRRRLGGPGIPAHPP